MEENEEDGSSDTEIEEVRDDIENLEGMDLDKEAI